MLVDLELRVGALIVLLVVPTDRTAAVLGCLRTIVRGSTVRDRSVPSGSTGLGMWIKIIVD